MLNTLNSTSVDYSTNRNQVLKNTYALLGLSMIPTALGAFIGVKTGIMASMGPIMSLILFLGVAFGFMYFIHKNKDNSLGVGLLLGFTFFMGVMLSNLLGFILGKSNGAQIIMTAFLGTGAILGGMATLATVIKRDLSGMGKFLFVGMIMLLVAGIINIFLQSPIMMIILSVLAIGIFSAYILYDVKQIIDGGETNYVVATLGLYLSVYNIFANLLSLLGIFDSND